MKEKHCNTCRYYRQHYALDHNKLFRVYCGHCTHERARRKKPDGVVCGNYELAPPDAESFATKAYLSKELLKYVLSLELLPDIRDAE